MNFTTKHIPALDALRGIAVLMVMFFHFSSSEFVSPSKLVQLIGKISVFGQTGVDLFFVLSGFLITRILLASKKDSSFFRKFYIRRALRIFPLYYGFLIIHFFIVPIATGGKVASFSGQIWGWIFLQNMPMTFPIGLNASPAHFWSLAVEEHFYLIWPVILYLNPSHRLKIILCAIILMAFVSRIILIELGFMVYYFTLCRFDALALGALLAVAELHYDGLSEFRKPLAIAASILLVFLCVFWIVVGGRQSSIVQVVKFSLISLFYFSVVGYFVSISSQRNEIESLLGRFLSFTGNISFGLYVFHPMVFGLLFEYLNFKNGNYTIEMVIGFLLSYSISLLSYNLYEKKFLRLKKYFEYDRVNVTSRTSMGNVPPKVL